MLKLTLVGVDEFDAARDEDAAGDDDFEDLVPLLPWHHPIHELATYRHPPHRSVAETFVNSIVQRVHKTKHERVKQNVKVMSAEEYWARVGPQRRRDEEDWWSKIENGMRC